MNRPLIVAHRGASHDAPENTLAAFRLAFEQGADAIEGDFHLTADGEVVCIHDGRTGRCGGRDLVVAYSTLAMLREVDVGSWKSPAYAGERIPTLDDVLAIVPPGKQIFIELKTGFNIVPAVAKVIECSGLSADQIRLISFDRRTLHRCKRVLPGLRTSVLVKFRQLPDGQWRPDPYLMCLGIHQLPGDGIGVEANVEVVKTHVSRWLHDAELHVWTIDDLATGDAFRALGVASITTNRPSLFVNRYE